MGEKSSLLGLNGYELKAYEALVKHGKSSGPQVSRDSDIPYGRVYDTLHSLVKKGLIKIIPGKTKKFIAGDQKKFLKVLKEKRKQIDELEKEINELDQIYDEDYEENLKVVSGKKNFYKILNELPISKKYDYVIRYDVMAPRDPIGTKKMIKKGVDIKNFADKFKANKKNLTAWKKLLPEMKHLKNEGVAISIIDDKIMMLVLIKSNLIMLIKDKPFIMLMKELYLNSYKKAKRI